ncbi:MAG: TrkH family potassium uptake protein [Oscillospiraceae bacterium]
MKLAERRRELFKFPAKAIARSFILVILVGTVILMLPISSKDGRFTDFLDALFTATSATCVTGLIVFDTYTKWTVFGQVIILMLIQIGGLGLVTITTFFNVALGKKLGLRSMQLAQESINSTSIIDISGIIRFVVTASLSIELLGAVMLSFTFVPKYGFEGIWISIFLAVSGFCNAGFDILGRETPFISLSNYTGSFNVNFTICMLIIVGGLGFIVWKDLYNYKKNKKLLLHTKIVLSVTGILIVSGFLMFMIMEWNNPKTMGGLSFFEKIGAAFFQSVTSRTAGFNTIDICALNGGTKVLTSLLMFIGAAPGSTGGGIKVTTATVVIMTVYSVIRGKDETSIMKRTISPNAVYKSLAILVMALVAVSICSGVMVSTLHNSLYTGTDTFFESVSAFATVGLSCGVTSVANVPSKILLIMLMFLGRVGPVSFALSLAMKGITTKKEILPEAKIMVG